MQKPSPPTTQSNTMMIMFTIMTEETQLSVSMIGWWSDLKLQPGADCPSEPN